MNEHQRKSLLERVNRESATVGAAIPDVIEVQGEEVNLREFVFEIKRRDTIPAGEEERVQQAKKNLRRERIERVSKIEDNEVSYEEGEELAKSIIGIDRALNALEGLKRGTDIQTEADSKEVADQKRWMNFLKKVLGHDGGPRV
ncbi:DUF5788 family protein [Natronomonas sp. EA1]|uniref:DUF5788 family protein n=1 Tax=Natronomonas sp. EA1 TaxID=3421655 RepID=UPI003EB6EB47